MARFPAVTKAVIPAAGLGTRFLPVTKAIPKEMLPVVDKPAIQYVVEEAVAAGLRDILMVTGRAKGALEDHFDRAPELEQALKAKGDDERLARIWEPAELATVHYTRQSIPRGLGHAVLCAAHHVGDEPFAVLLGAIQPTDTGGVVTVTDLVEKPAPGDAPSNWIIIGRYVCDPAVFDVLRDTPPGRGGEIQLTDALKTLAQMPAGDGGGLRGVQFRGRRFDTGNPVDYLRTVIQFALERRDVAAEFLPWLRKYLDSQP